MTSYPPAFVDEFSYARPSVFSGTSATSPAVGVSGIYDGLSGVEGYSYVIFGWQGFYYSKQTNDKGNYLIQISCNLGTCAGLIYCRTASANITMLPQPLKLPSGSGVYRKTILKDMKADDSFYTNIFYTLVPDR